MSHTDTTYAPEPPSKFLPPMPYKDIPEAPKLKKVIGPSIIMTALAVSSGEYILWPYITSKVGLVMLWAAIVGVTVQYFLNMEIERWTLATGETAIAGFVRLWKPWGAIMAVCAFICIVWPGWATSGAATLGFALGYEGRTASWVAVIALIAMAITLTLSPVVYNTVEKIETFKVVAVVAFLIVALTTAIGPQAWGDLHTAVSGIGTGLGAIPEGLSPAVVLGAIAFAGAGALSNLAQSNWIRDKGFGMGAHIPRVVSPVTGEDVAATATGSMVRQDEENLRRFRSWWRVANVEQLISFWLLTILSIFVLSMVAYQTVFNREVPGSGDLVFIQGMGEALKETVGGWFGTLFWVVGGGGLLLTALANVDYPCRIVADVLKTVYLKDNPRWSESKIYALSVWILVTCGCTIILAGFNQPLVLLVVSAALSGVVMFVYTILVMVLNRRALPVPIRLGGFRLGVMIFAACFYGYFSLRLVTYYGGQLFGL
ncbi:Nramp family divalent metal transporter [Mycobacterium sp. SMC-8]|uniref:Nramp family divalent metal transporter n=1 Tax=Mycobacterium sp. SMC-8 TaxID=2857060 RepID=UPI0021B22C72|nr:Nramp family divalent metal transporter [Mycobacterium sp. SMC-8]UXA11189.1 Nramp family divalent metal transporter [Mycobacterium sp. SMC-8]